MPDTPTGHELLIRIDERQESMAKQLTSLCSKVEKKVDDNKEYQQLVMRVDSLWDTKNKFVGWMIGSAGIGGIAGALATQIKEVLAR